MRGNQLINPELLKILACPICKSDVRVEGKGLSCVNCQATYPINNGVPIMIVKDSEHYKHQREYFNKEFRTYKKYRLENWRISYLERIFEALEIKNDLKIGDDLYLDVGVGGSGYTVIEAAKKGVRSIGTDLSLVGMQQAKKFAREEGIEKFCHFVVSSAEALPFRNKTFSKISSIAVLEHIPDDKQAIAEMARIIRAKGKIFVTVPNSYRYISPLFWFPCYVHDKRIGHLRHYWAEDLADEFRKRKFVVKEILYSGHFVKMVQIFLSLIFSHFEASKLWWVLERMDLEKKRGRHGLQLHLIGEKAPP